jgi:hypothetical protein
VCAWHAQENSVEGHIAWVGATASEKGAWADLIDDLVRCVHQSLCAASGFFHLPERSLSFLLAGSLLRQRSHRLCSCSLFVWIRGASRGHHEETSPY